MVTGNVMMITAVKNASLIIQSNGNETAVIRVPLLSYA